MLSCEAKKTMRVTLSSDPWTDLYRPDLTEIAAWPDDSRDAQKLENITTQFIDSRLQSADITGRSRDHDLGKRSVMGQNNNVVLTLVSRRWSSCTDRWLLALQQRRRRRRRRALKTDPRRRPND